MDDIFGLKEQKKSIDKVLDWKPALLESLFDDVHSQSVDIQALIKCVEELNTRLKMVEYNQKQHMRVGEICPHTLK